MKARFNPPRHLILVRARLLFLIESYDGASSRARVYVNFKIFQLSVMALKRAYESLVDVSPVNVTPGPVNWASIWKIFVRTSPTATDERGRIKSRGEDLLCRARVLFKSETSGARARAFLRRGIKQVTRARAKSTFRPAKPLL